MGEDVEMVAFPRRDNVPVAWFCRHCGEPLQMVTDPVSGLLDFGANGDFGCDKHPDTDEEGSASHQAVVDTVTFRAYWARGEEYDDREAPW